MSLVLISCGGGSDPTPEPQNTAPSVPSLVAPASNKLCISNIVSFEWSVSADAEKNPIVYQLQIATDNQFAQIVSATDVSTPLQIVTLDKGKAYYWRVKATDSKNASSAYSSINSFYTEVVAVSNYAPFMPQLVSPTNDATIAGTITTLKWTGSDVDLNDVLSFDVYLGTELNPTTKVVDNKTVKSFDATLQATKIYYWKVVVRDNKGGETSGQVWSFKTN
nr:hypothetical protein [uncultured Flavobacterium sp.]